MKPLPWSPTALDDFNNCPQAFWAKRVVKIVQEEPSAEKDYGNYIHKQFELRQSLGTQLPEDLAPHEVFMRVLEKRSGEKLIEHRAAFNQKLEICEFTDEDVWYRCIIDYATIDGPLATIVDYKSGKQHYKFRQLTANALWIFYAYPRIETISACFYWTKTFNITTRVYKREQLLDMWKEFIPDLSRYVEAFEKDVWPLRKSGLCFGWCPFTDCRYWRPKRTK